MGLDDIFGSKSWQDVHSEVMRRLRRRYYGRVTTSDDIADAVAGSMLDLVDYWVHLPSSLDHDDPERNYKWACWRATRTATQFLIQRFDERRSQVPLLDEEGDDGHEYYPDPSPGPEERACEVDEAASARDLMDSLPEVDQDTWLPGFLRGLSTYECAAVSGRGQKTEWRRRERGLLKVRALAKARGMFP